MKYFVLMISVPAVSNLIFRQDRMYDLVVSFTFSFCETARG